MFSSYCEVQMLKSPTMEEKGKQGETPNIPPFSQVDEWWNRAKILEAICNAPKLNMFHCLYSP